MSGVYLSEKVKKLIIRAEQDDVDEYKRLRKEVNFFKSTDICNEIPNALLLLLNIRGIIKNHKNIVKDGTYYAVP